MSALARRFDLAVGHHQAGHLQKAEQLYREILQVDPQHVDALHFLGLIAGQVGRHDVASEYIRQALRLKPDFAAAHYNLGNAFREQGKLDEAIASYREAVRFQPDLAEAHHNLGNGLRAQGKPQEAAASFQCALRLKPGFAEAHYNLGNTQLELGQATEAAASFERAVQLQPDFVDALGNLGLVWRNLGRFDEAESCLRRALRLKPDFALAHNNLGNVLKETGDLAEARACYGRAVRISPDYVQAHSNILNLLHFCWGHDRAAIHEEHRLWNERHAQPLAKFIRGHTNDPAPERRLRVGYVSADFRDHVVGHNVLPLVRHHDPGQFEITLYANLARPDWMTEQFRQCAQNWRGIGGWPDDRVADKIVGDGIDILVDLSLHMSGNRLLVFARKPAPVQVTFAGYPGSTGLTAIDYRLSDPYLDPPGMYDRWYAEETYRLPDSFWCYCPQAGAAPVNELPALKNGYLTFGCLNNFCKVNVPMLKTWAQVLGATEGSRLVLLAPEGAHRGRLLNGMEQEGIAPGRITFVAPGPRAQYLEVYHQIDLGLDTLPYNGHTTSLDSLWMGVPLVTMVGQTVVGRAGVSQLTNLGLGEWIASTPEELVRLAVGLAADLPRLSTLRATLRERMQNSPLMDAPRFTRNIEAAYRDMWRRWCESRSEE